MFTGFTYKGIHTDEYGIISKTKNRPILPTQKTVMINIQNADSEYDFSSANVYERPFYEDRIFEIELLITATGIYELQNKLNSIAVWLMGNGELVFDDIPDVKWNANVINGVDFAPKIYGKEAILSVQFRVKPWSECVHDSEELSNITIGSDIPLNLGIRIDPSAYFNFILKNGLNTVNIINLGTYYARPIFEFSGVCNSLSLTCGNRTLEYNHKFKKLSVDLEKHCFSENGVFMNKYGSGDFFELKAGENMLYITLDGTVDMKIIYTPKFIYANTMFGGE